MLRLPFAREAVPAHHVRQGAQRSSPEYDLIERGASLGALATILVVARRQLATVAAVVAAVVAAALMGW